MSVQSAPRWEAQHSYYHLPKAPWKPRITLAVEVNNLIDWGMMDNYDQESEHSVTVQRYLPQRQMHPSP